MRPLLPPGSTDRGTVSKQFSTPTTRPVAAGRDVFWSHFQQTRSTSILKTAGAYTEVDGPSDAQIAAADITYLGGHIYTVSDAEAALLTTAGYGSGLH